MVIFSIISSLINAASSLIFGVFVIRQNSRNAKNRTYFFFSFSVALWSIFYFFWQISKTPSDALFNSRGLMLGAIFIPVFYLHHIIAILGKTDQCRRQLILAYGFAVSSSLFSFTPFFVSGVSPKLSYQFWPNPGPLFHPFLLFWVVVVAYGAKLIFESFRNASGIVRNQMKYILFATMVGWGGLVVFQSYENLSSRKLMRKTSVTSTGEQWTLYYRKPFFWDQLLKKIGFEEMMVIRDDWKMNNICSARKTTD